MDEASIIAWIDGELASAEADRVARAVAGDPALAELAEAHRDMRARFDAAFATLAMPAAAEVVSLADVRAQRAERARRPRRWIPAALAASLVGGVLLGQLVPRSGGISDNADALALSPALGRALDQQLSGDGATVRVALSFRDRAGRYCRSFTASRLSGVACKDDGLWHLRYGEGAAGARTDYRMAGSEPVAMAAVTAMIAGEPFDRDQEQAARARGWR
ncbi:hypothetical protein KZ810_12825 [Sphingomonas sp. RHCKR47]|nr:hypothetical protein [Sphingomonas citricola]